MNTVENKLTPPPGPFAQSSFTPAMVLAIQDAVLFRPRVQRHPDEIGWWELEGNDDETVYPRISR